MRIGCIVPLTIRMTYFQYRISADIKVKYGLTRKGASGSLRISRTEIGDNVVRNKSMRTGLIGGLTNFHYVIKSMLPLI